MGDVIMTNLSNPPQTLNPRDQLVELFSNTGRCPNIVWALERGNGYVPGYNAKEHFENLFTNEEPFLQSIEAGLGEAYASCKDLENRLKELQNEHQALQTRFTDLTNHRDELAAQNKTLADNLSSWLKTIQLQQTKKKRESTDPDKFDGKGSPAERQQNFEIFEAKIRSVFDRDLDYFDTEKSRIGHVSDLLIDKAWDYIQPGLEAFRKNPADPDLPSTTWEQMLDHLGSHYKTMDLTQWSKNKLDNFCQNDRNYWSWKGEFDEHTLRAKKTPEQKVDLLLKLVSPAMKDLITTLSDPPSFDDYKGWSGKLDVFARNLQNRAHQNKMDKGTTGGLNHHRPPLATDPGNATPVDRGDPMDLSAAQHGSSRLPEHEIQRRRTTGACTACGEHGHWKDAHRWSTTNPNPLPMPPRQTAPQRGGWNTDRGGRGHGRGSSFPSRGTGYISQPYGAYPPTRQPQSYRGPQFQLRAADHEHGHVISEVSSSYTPTETDTASQPSQGRSHHSSPAPLSSKGQPFA